MAEERKAVDESADLVAETVDEHRHCLQVVADLEACLEKAPDAEGAWLAAVLERLPVLATTLEAHFADEEAGPMFTRLPHRFPRFDARLKELKDEHVRMSAAVAEAIARAEAMRGSDPFDLRELKAQLQLLVARLRRHEAAEYEIVVEAHWDEVGVGD